MANPIVQIQYDDLEQVAQNLLTQADALDHMRRILTQRVSDLESGGWQGRGSDAFLDEMNNDVLPAVRRLIDALERGCETTRQIMSTFASAEEEASTRFEVLAPQAGQL